MHMEKLGKRIDKLGERIGKLGKQRLQNLAKSWGNKGKRKGAWIGTGDLGNT